MSSMARLLKVDTEELAEGASGLNRRRLAAVFPSVPLSGSCTNCASRRHTCK